MNPLKNRENRNLRALFNDRVFQSTDDGSVRAVYTLDGVAGSLNEQFLHHIYLKYCDALKNIRRSALGKQTEDEYRQDLLRQREEYSRGRAYVQAFKLENGIELDTMLCFHKDKIRTLTETPPVKPAREPSV